MKRIDYTLAASDGLELSAVNIAPDGEVKCVLQMLHGMAEHKERYIPMMETLARQGIFCSMHDMRGHGKSLVPGEVPGYFGGDAEQLVRDAFAFTGKLREEHPGVPLVLYGHSMGAITARAFRMEHGEAADGYIFCGTPAGNTSGAPGRAAIALMKPFIGDRKQSRLFDGIVTGPFSKRFRSEGSRLAWLSRDTQVVRAYEQDPLCGFPFTLNGYAALMGLIDIANREADAGCPDAPVLFISGENDPCMPDRKALEKAVEHTRRTGCRSLTCKVYPGMRHEIHNERGKEEVFRDIASFALGV